jgi:serine/threonine-protein kinase
MLFIAVGVPLSLALVPGLVSLVPPRFVNLPNRDYWLAPEQVTETFTFLRKHGIYLSGLLAAFLCFIHWLVVAANKLQPPRFSASLFVTGLALFLFAVAVWVGVLFVHFRRPKPMN